MENPFLKGNVGMSYFTKMKRYDNLPQGVELLDLRRQYIQK
jgi:hypothetical protein